MVNFIFSKIFFLYLFYLRFDYETSSHQCTIDPCSNSQEKNSINNQTFFSVYRSSHFTYGYLKRISKLEINTAKIIFYLLIIILILISIFSIIFIFILHLSDKYEKTVYPTRSPSIIIQKAPKPTKDEYNQIYMNLTPTNSE